jgi:hypothetical protein
MPLFELQTAVKLLFGSQVVQNEKEYLRDNLTKCLLVVLIAQYGLMRDVFVAVPLCLILFTQKRNNFLLSPFHCRYRVKNNSIPFTHSVFNVLLHNAIVP